MDPSKLPPVPTFHSKADIRTKFAKHTRTFIYALCKHMWADEGMKPGRDFQMVVASASKLITEKIKNFVLSKPYSLPNERHMLLALDTKLIPPHKSIDSYDQYKIHVRLSTFLSQLETNLRTYNDKGRSSNEHLFCAFVGKNS